MRAFVTINRIGCFSPAVALALFSLLVPFLVWAENVQDVQDDNNKDQMDYTSVDVQYQNDARVRALDNAQLANMAADIKSIESSSIQRTVNYVWLREASSEKKPVTGGKAAGKIMRAVAKQAWKQWRENSAKTSKWLPNNQGAYALTPAHDGQGMDYSMQFDGRGLMLDVDINKNSSYQVKLDGGRASIGYEHRF